MEFLVTVVLATLLIGVAFFVFHFFGTPFYRLEPINVRRLLESVLAETATVADWDVFIGMPIRHNPDLERIRKRCAELAESEMTERNDRVIFTAQGRSQLQEMLDSL